MSTGPINGLSRGYLQSLLATHKAKLDPSGLSGLSGVQKDSTQLSPFANLMSTLQQLQQSNPAQYQQVTQQISTNLQTAAQTAQDDNNTAATNQLNQLSTDFGSASQSGQLPNIQDLAQAVAGKGHHGHHHGHHAVAPASDTNSTADSTSTSNTTNQSLSQILSAFQANTAQSDAFNPMSIIMNTLSTAGIAS